MSKTGCVKKKKGVPQDIKGIQELIKQIWPDYPYKEQSLIDLTSDFVMGFYSMYLNKFYDVIDFCKNSPELNDSENLEIDFMSTCPKHIKKEIFIFNEINRILHEINITYFSITDLYAPQNRTRTTIKILLNLLLYMINIQPESVNRYKDELEDFKKILTYQNVQDQLMEDLLAYNNNNGKMLDDLDKDDHMASERSSLLKAIEEIEKGNQIKQDEVNTLKYHIMQIDKNNVIMQENVINKDVFDIKSKDTEFIKKIILEKDAKIFEQNDLITEKSKNLNHLKYISVLLDTVDLNACHSFKEIEDTKEFIERENVIKNNLSENVKKLKEENRKQKIVEEELINEIKLQEKSFKNTCNDCNKKMKESNNKHQKDVNTYEKLELMEKECADRVELLNKTCNQIAADTEADSEAVAQTYQSMCDKYQILKDVAKSEYEKLCFIYERMK